MPIRWAAAFTLGCGAVLLKADPWPAWVLLLVAPALIWRPARGMALFLVIGLVWTEWQVRERLAAQWPADRHGETLTVRGWVSSLPGHHRGQERSDWRFRFTPDTAEDSGLPRHIRVSWYDGPEELQAGGCWTLQLRLRTPRGSMNPGGFDYEGWLFRSGLGATASVRAAEPCGDPSVAADRSQFSRAILKARARWVDRLEARLDDHPGAAYLRALGVGDGQALGAERWEVYRRTGTAHLMVISGLHLGLVTGLGYLLFRALWPLWPALALRVPTPIAAGVVAGLLATVYAALAGFEPPVVRALLAVWLGLFIAWRGGWRAPWRALALIWLLVVAWDPLHLMRPGVWLSFTAVAAITYWRAFRISPMFGWRALLGLQLGLGLLMMPLTLGFYGGATAMAPLVNLMAVPLFTLLTPLALLTGLLNIAWEGEAVSPIIVGVATLFSWVDAGLAAAAQAGQPLWWQRPVGWLVSVLGVCGVLLVTAPRGMPGKWLAVPCFVPLLIPTAPARDPLTISVLDVGQGTAVVVATQNHALLYDTGPSWDGGFDAGAAVVVPYLHQAGHRRIDTLMISHGDRDHAGGAAAVRAALPIDLERGEGTERPCAAGQSWRWDGVDFEVLHPQTEVSAALRSRNDHSCVLRISVGGQRVLLAGDIEAAGERSLLRRQGEALSAQLLLVPHHGSRTSSSRAFVEAVMPQAAIVSAGWRHQYGHPHPQVSARYRARNVALWSTAEHGALIWRLDGGDALPPPIAWREVARRRWHAAVAP